MINIQITYKQYRFHVLLAMNCRWKKFGVTDQQKKFKNFLLTKNIIQRKQRDSKKTTDNRKMDQNKNKSIMQQKQVSELTQQSRTIPMRYLEAVEYTDNLCERQQYFQTTPYSNNKQGRLIINNQIFNYNKTNQNNQHDKYPQQLPNPHLEFKPNNCTDALNQMIRKQQYLTENLSNLDKQIQMINAISYGCLQKQFQNSLCPSSGNKSSQSIVKNSKNNLYNYLQESSNYFSQIYQYSKSSKQLMNNLIKISMQVTQSMTHMTNFSMDKGNPQMMSKQQTGLVGISQPIIIIYEVPVQMQIQQQQTQIREINISTCNEIQKLKQEIKNIIDINRGYCHQIEQLKKELQRKEAILAQSQSDDIVQIHNIYEIPVQMQVIEQQKHVQSNQMSSSLSYSFNGPNPQMVVNSSYAHDQPKYHQSDQRCDQQATQQEIVEIVINNLYQIPVQLQFKQNIQVHTQTELQVSIIDGYTQVQSEQINKQYCITALYSFTFLFNQSANKNISIPKISHEIGASWEHEHNHQSQMDFRRYQKQQKYDQNQQFQQQEQQISRRASAHKKKERRKRLELFQDHIIQDDNINLNTEREQKKSQIQMQMQIQLENIVNSTTLKNTVTNSEVDSVNKNISQAQGNQQNYDSLTKMMQNLLKSQQLPNKNQGAHQIDPKTESIQYGIPNQEDHNVHQSMDDQITYKCRKNTIVSVDSSNNYEIQQIQSDTYNLDRKNSGNIKSSNVGQNKNNITDEFFRQSVIFVQNSNIQIHPPSPQINNQNRIKNHFPNYSQSESQSQSQLHINSKQNVLIGPKANLLNINPKLQQSQGYNSSYENYLQHEPEQSLHIHGISVISAIRRRPENSQTNSNSQIQEYIQIQGNENISQVNHHFKYGVLQTGDVNNSENNVDLNLDLQKMQQKLNQQKTPTKNKVSVNKNRSLGTSRNYVYNYNLGQIQNIIEQRCNSEESKSKRTTLKNFISNNNGHHAEYQYQQQEDFMFIDNINNYMQKQGRNIFAKHMQNQVNIQPITHSNGKNQQLQKSLIIEHNKIQQTEIKKAKQRLSEHPLLNFIQGSQLQQSVVKNSSSIRNNHDHLQIKMKKNESKNQTLNNNSSGDNFYEQSLLINLNLNKDSRIKQSNQEQKDLYLKTLIKNLKNTHNQVLFIDGETSSQGSRANRQMRISTMRNQLSGCNYEVSQLTNNANTSNMLPQTDSISRTPQSKNNMQECHVQNSCPQPNLYYSTPHNTLKQEIVDISEYNELKQKALLLEQQKSKLLQELCQYDSRIQQLKNHTIVQQENLCRSENTYKNKLAFIVEQITAYDQKLEDLQLQLEQKTTNYEQIYKRAEEKDKKIQFLLTDLAKKQEIIQQKAEDIKTMNESYELEVKNLQNQLIQKQNNIKQLKQQYEQTRQQFELASSNFNISVKQRDVQIQKNCKEIQKYCQVIQNLKGQYEQVVCRLEIVCKEKEQYMAIVGDNLQLQRDKQMLVKIYEGQFTKSKQNFTKQMQVKSQKILSLQSQSSSLQEQCMSLQKRIITLTEELSQNELKVQLLENQLRNQKKIEVNEQIQAELDYLRKQLVSSNREVQYKQQIIQKLEENIKKIEAKIIQIQQSKQILSIYKSSPPNNKEFESPIKKNNQINHKGIKKRESIQKCFKLNFGSQKFYEQKQQEEERIPQNKFPKHLHTVASITNPTVSLIEAPPAIFLQLKEAQQKVTQLYIQQNQTQSYIEELERVILNYEQILLNNQKIIKQLQDQVSEYLFDAVDKQRQNEQLYRDIENYQSQINQILLQKINVEIENKRMKKMIAASERRISAIGTRLIHAAKDKLKMKDEMEMMGMGIGKKSQNSTLKMRQLRIQ